LSRIGTGKVPDLSVLSYQELDPNVVIHQRDTIALNYPAVVGWLAHHYRDQQQRLYCKLLHKSLNYQDIQMKLKQPESQLSVALHCWAVLSNAA